MLLSWGYDLVQQIRSFFCPTYFSPYFSRHFARLAAKHLLVHGEVFTDIVVVVKFPTIDCCNNSCVRICARAKLRKLNFQELFRFKFDFSYKISRFSIRFSNARLEFFIRFSNARLKFLNNQTQEALKFIVSCQAVVKLRGLVGGFTL